MGFVITFIVGAWFGIVLMGLCVAASHQDQHDKSKDIHGTGDDISCYCDKE